MIRLLEELTLNAWPALQTVAYDGWLLRFAEGFTRRANSVQPLYPSTLDLAAKLAHCEGVYHARGLDCVFKLTSAALPLELDGALALLSYQLDAPTVTQTVSLVGRIPDAKNQPGLELRDSFSDAWGAAFFRLGGRAARYVPTMERMLANLIPAAAYVSLEMDGHRVAVGLGVLEAGYVGLYDIAVAETYRKRGFGRQIVERILDWGATQGAHTAYLSVMQDNAPALHLYNKVGFREAYRYWYRVKPAAK